MASDLTRDEMLAALQQAIEDNPTPRRDRSDDVLNYIRLAHEENLGPLTCKQLAQILELKRKHTSTILNGLRKKGLIRYEVSATQTFLWYYVSCNESDS